MYFQFTELRYKCSHLKLCLVSCTASVSFVQARILMCGLQPAECVWRLFSVCLAELPYRVAIFPSRKTSAASTSANAWVTVSGTLGETSPVPIPRGALEFVFRVSEWMCSVHCCSVTVLYRDVTALFYCSTRIWASSRLWGLDTTTPGLHLSGWWSTWWCVTTSRDTHTSK